MARLWTLGGFILLIIATTFAPAHAADVPDVKIGMYQTMFRDVTPEMLAAFAKPLQSTIEKTIGVTGGAELVPDAATLATRLDDKKFQLGVFHGFEFAWQKQKHPDLEPLLVAVPNKNLLKAVVVVNAANPAKSLADLKNQSIAVPKNTKGHCLLWLEDQRKGFAATTAAVVEKPKLMADELLSEVVGGDCPGIVLDAAAYEGYAKVYPGNAKALKVLATSESFPFAVLAYHKNGLKEEVRKRVVAGLSIAHTHALGKPLMMLWSLERFDEPPADYNEQLAVILKAYPEPTPIKVVPGTLTGREKESEKNNK